MNKPKISIILPFYNAEFTLKRALESIKQQTYKCFECILIDNNSTDKSYEVAKEYVNTDHRFILIKEIKQGVVFASNAGSRITQGEYVCRMDADDYSPPQRLQLQNSFLDDNKEVGVVSGMVKYVSHISNTKGFARYVKWVNSLTTPQQIYDHRFVESPIINPSAMWRNAIAEKYGMYKNGNFPEDYEMWLRWLGKGVRMYKLSETVLHWHDSFSRLTRTHPIYSDIAFFKIKTQYLIHWLKNNNPFYPKVVIWGASRISRQRAKLLLEYGITIENYIDIHQKRQLSTDVIYYKDIPNPGNIFILCYIKEIKARKQIQVFLEERNYKVGIHYLLVS